MDAKQRTKTAPQASFLGRRPDPLARKSAGAGAGAAAANDDDSPRDCTAATKGCQVGNSTRSKEC